MILECKKCQAVVQAEELFTYDDDEIDDGFPIPGRWTLSKCPICTTPLLTVQTEHGGGWQTPNRVYPVQEKELNSSIPKSIREAFKEASVCFRAKAYTASAIMCRKTLEGICASHKIKERTLAGSLAKLKENGIIEARLFEWAEELRIFGNRAAHGVELKVKPQDAKDILEFTEALCEYVFTYRDKFEEFKARKEKEES